MAGGSTPALICDTSALLDYLVANAPDHRTFKDALNRAGTRYVPGLVLAELNYFLRHKRAAMRRSMCDLRRDGRSDCAMAARLSWSSVQGIRTGRNRRP